MKAASVLFAVSLLLLTACGQSEGEKKIISVEKKEVLKESVAVIPNQKMTLKVKGMSCEHACGGSIRMALKETGAVDRCSFDFEADRPENTAFITYDDTKITPKKIISIIETINDKQFTTADPTVKSIDAEQPAIKTKTKEAAVPKESAETLPVKTEEDNIVNSGGGQSSLDFPGAIQLFSRILTIQ